MRYKIEIENDDPNILGKILTIADLMIDPDNTNPNDIELIYSLTYIFNGLIGYVPSMEEEDQNTVIRYLETTATRIKEIVEEEKQQNN